MSADETQGRPRTKKKIAIASLLALAALGTRILPQRPMLVNEPEPRAVALDTSDDPNSHVNGQNSLFGAILDQPAPPSMVDASADLGRYHLEMSSLVEQAGRSASVPSIPWLDASAREQFAAASGSDISPGTASALSAVPEPSSTAILLMAVTPILILRRPKLRR